MKDNISMPGSAGVVPSDLRPLIHEIRGVQVMLDRDLAALYDVLTKNLNKAVKRNIERFPVDFMFQLSKEECLRFQNGTSKNARGGTRYAPYAFTENGIAMLSSVLRSERAIAVNVRIMREFTAMRRAFASTVPMQVRIDAVERRYLADQSRNEARFDEIFARMSEGSLPEHQIFYQGQFDQKELYSIGASLKDAGRLTFGVSKTGEALIPALLDSLRKATSAQVSYGLKSTGAATKKGGMK